MKHLVFCLLILRSITSFGQMNLPSIIKLDETVNSLQNVKLFIKHEFKDFKATKNELLAVDHPLVTYKFNKVLSNGSHKFSLNGLPIKAIYAYDNNEKEVALYLFLDVSLAQVNLLINLFGSPWNVTDEDLKTGDYDVLLWDKQLYNINMLHDFVTGSPGNSRQLCIYSGSLSDLANTDPWDE